MKIVITGALGHIGSRLLRELPEFFPNSEILMIDNMSTQRYCSLFNLPNHNYKFLEADILKIDLEKTFSGYDVVIHLAAITDAANSFDKKDLVEEVNLRGTEKVALACLNTGSSLITISTTSVYGTQNDIVDESCSESELCPQSPYAESKLAMERLVVGLNKTNGLKSVVCRFGTIFGASPGMRFHTAVNKFIWQACMGLPITVWRTAMDQNRPYLDLGDACRSMEFIIRNNLFNGEVYNVLTLNASVNDILNEIRKNISVIDINLVDSKIMNQLSYNVCCKKFSSLGFEFNGSLSKSIEESINMLNFGARCLKTY